MRIVADYHNTVSRHSEFFGNLGEFNDLFIVTGSSKSKEPVIKMLLKANRIPYREIYCFPNDWNDQNEKVKSMIWKVDKMVELKPDLVIDDSPTTLLGVKKKLPNTMLLLLLNDGYKID